MPTDAPALPAIWWAAELANARTVEIAQAVRLNLPWLADSIGGSQIAALAHVRGAYGNPARVFDTLRGTERTRGSSEAMRRGTAMEPLIRDRVRAHCAQIDGIGHGTFISTPATQYFSVTLPGVPAHVLPCARVSVDGMLHQSAAHLPHAVVEIKSLGTATFAACARADHGVPPAYYAQLQWYMGCLRISHGLFVAEHAARPTDDLYVRLIAYNHAYFIHLLRVALMFWQYVHTNIRPPQARTLVACATDMMLRAPAAEITVTAALHTTYRHPNPESATAMPTPNISPATTVPVTVSPLPPSLPPTTMQQLAHDFVQAKSLYDEAKRLYDGAREALEGVMTGGPDPVTGILLADGTRVTRTEGTRTTTDWTGFRNEHPDVDVSRYERRTVSVTLRVIPATAP